MRRAFCIAMLLFAAFCAVYSTVLHGGAAALFGYATHYWLYQWLRGDDG